MVIPSRPIQATTVLNQNMPTREESNVWLVQCFLTSVKTNKLFRLTLRNEGSDEAGGSSHEVGRGEGKASADAFNGEEYEEGSGKLHQARDEEVDVDISSQDAQPHDQTLVDHGTGEPARGRVRMIRNSLEII